MTEQILHDTDATFQADMPIDDSWQDEYDDWTDAQNAERDLDADIDEMYENWLIQHADEIPFTDEDIDRAVGKLQLREVDTIKRLLSEMPVGFTTVMNSFQVKRRNADEWALKVIDDDGVIRSKEPMIERHYAAALAISPHFWTKKDGTPKILYLRVHEQTLRTGYTATPPKSVMNAFNAGKVRHPWGSTYTYFAYNDDMKRYVDDRKLFAA